MDIEVALRAVAPHLTSDQRSAWGSVIGCVADRAAINTPRRLAAFIGQCAVESAGFTALEENLSYSAARIAHVWPSRFPTIEAAEPYSRAPERLANHVYANRLGNGDEASGDGWRFRGGGLIQLTGRDNFTAFGKAHSIDAEAAAEWSRKMPGAAASAAWFWSSRKLNALADGWQITALTRAVNGGTNALPERIGLCNVAVSILAGRDAR